MGGPHPCCRQAWDLRRGELEGVGELGSPLDTRRQAADFADFKGFCCILLAFQWVLKGEEI
jgi:hypothetical protein